MNFNNLKTKLRSTSGHAFQHLVYDIMKPLMPDLQYAKDLGQLDRSGIDLVWTDKDDKYIQVIQCKGFELAGFGEDQFAQCKKSIDTFIKSGITAEEYILIINRGATTKEYAITYKSMLLEEMAHITSSKKASEVILYDTDSFLDYIHMSIETDIRDLMLSSCNNFRNEYMQRMNQVVYIDRTPFQFQTSDETEERIDPINFLIRQLSLRQYSYSEFLQTLKAQVASYENDWHFIVGEFGFGKTSLLLNLAHRLNKNYMFLYIPVALLSKDFIANNYCVSKNILQVFLGFDSDMNSITHSLYPQVLSDMLKRRTDITLLVDGIDEGSFLYYDNGLRKFFSLFKEYNTSIIFTLRQEFYYEKGDEFEKAVKSRWDNKKIIFLQEWENTQMSEYVTGVLAKNFNVNLQKFNELILSNRYFEYFGDIPKRPLFLQMLCDDILNGNFSKKTRDELYEDYFLRKFSIDRATSVGDMATEGRPLSYGEGEQKVAFKIMRILEDTAGKLMTMDDEFHFTYRESIDEYELEDIIKKYFSQANEIMEFLLHSVLIPQYIRSIDTKALRLRFAHRSFQEFFTRKYFQRRKSTPASVI